MLRDRHGGRDVGEGNAGDHRQTGTNQPHTVQLQAGAETCDQQAGLNDGGGLRGIHLGGRGHQEDRREIRHEHGHDVLQAERNALPERHRCVKTAQRLKRHAFFHVFCLRLFSVFSMFFSSLNCYILSYNRLSVLKKSGAEFDGAVFRIHRFDDCQGIDVVPFLTQLVATALEALFHCDADAFHSGSGLMAQLDQAF